MLNARRFRVFLLLASLLLPAALPGPALAGGPTVSGGVLLRYAFRAGEVRRYAVTMSIELQLPTAPALVRADFEMQAALRTERVLPDGSAMVATVIERMEFFLMGDRVPLPDVSELTTRHRMYPDGRVTESEVDRASLERLGFPAGQQLPLVGGRGGFTQGVAGTSTQLPGRPMRVGEFIDRDQTVDLSALALAGGAAGGSLASTPLTARSRLTLEELSTLGGRRVARLTETITASLPTMAQGEASVGVTMNGRVSNLLDVATAWPVSGEGALDATYTLNLPSGEGRIETLPIQVAMRISYRQA